MKIVISYQYGNGGIVQTDYHYTDVGHMPDEKIKEFALECFNVHQELTDKQRASVRRIEVYNLVGRVEIPHDKK